MSKQQRLEWRNPRKMQPSSSPKPFLATRSRPIDLVATRWRHVDRKSVVFGEESLLPCSSRPCFAVQKRKHFNWDHNIFAELLPFVDHGSEFFLVDFQYVSNFFMKLFFGFINLCI
ncbi:hypothetical protein H5410_038102 [Solanum commersonii]|uniref:Uncharacterized protein n=1 Tax=Solanum commersonii TaxID=4109 RepID=A0A9J5YCZ9_SOLCO|nr:hypothetical protein H5410_038102 [Solanum commersonii]